MKNKKNGGSIFFVILAIIAVAAGVFVFLEYRDRQSIELASVPVDTQTETVLNTRLLKLIRAFLLAPVFRVRRDVIQLLPH